MQQQAYGVSAITISGTRLTRRLSQCYSLVTKSEGRVVIVTLEQSIAIYAKASRKWFGAKAVEKTEQRIDRLTKAGDHEGASVHEKVKQHILKLEEESRRAAHKH